MKRVLHSFFVPMIRKFLTHFMPAVMKPLRVLWNEIIGFVFICFAIVSIPSVYRGINSYSGEIAEVGRIVLSAFFSCVMLFCGVTSFLRARKIGRP
jgi:hypothetical protein